MSEARPWKVSIVGQADVDPRTLTPHPQNPKVHPAEQDAVVEASLRQLGWLKRVMVNRVTGHLLDGHERVELAVRRGERLIPVEYVEVPEALEGTALLTLDESATLAKRHLGRWAALVGEARQVTHEAPLLGLWEQLAKREGITGVGETDPRAPLGTLTEQREQREAELAAEIEALRQTWGAQAGQVWQCGRHRVWCGDSLSAAVETQLIRSTPVDLVVTSPPYAVGKGYEAEAGPDEHRGMLRALATMCGALVRPGGFVVVNFASLWSQTRAAAWTGSARACLYPMELEYWQAWHVERGWDLYAQRVWVKPFGRLRQPLHTYHTSLAQQQEWEHVWTWRLPGDVQEQAYDWDLSVHAVWQTGVEIDADGGPWAHWSAGFPQVLPRWVLRAHSAPQAVVWEPFLGGGSTLLACEEVGRTCLASDRDPGAVAVTLARFYEATGVRPQLGRLD